MKWRIRVLLYWRSRLWDLICIFPGKQHPIWKPWLPTCLLTHEPSPPSWASSKIQPGCCWSSKGWVQSEALWNVYVPALGCLQSYSELFDSSQHRLAAVYLSLFPTGFVCTIRPAERRSERAASPPLSQAATRASGAKGSMTWYRKCSGLTDAISISKLSAEPAPL